MAFNDNGTIKPVEPRQAKYRDSTSGNPHVVFDAAPVADNLVLAFLFQGGITDGNINTSSWTIFAKVTGSPGVSGTMYGLYRYVQGGDTATLPDLSNVVSGGHVRAVAVELQNVCGDWLHTGTSHVDSDFYADTSDNNAPPISVPAVDGEFQVGVMCGLNGRGEGTYTPGSGWINLIKDNSYPETSGAVTLDFKYFGTLTKSPDPTSPSWSGGTTTGAWIVAAIRSDGVARSSGGVAVPGRHVPTDHN